MAITVKDVAPVLKGGEKIVLTSHKGSVEYNGLIENAFGDYVVSSILFDHDENFWKIKILEIPERETKQ